jgi:hypothetical protein
VKLLSAIMPGKCSFQESWLSHPDYGDWVVRVPGNKHAAQCKLCRKTKPINISIMGMGALKSHHDGDKHQDLLRISREMPRTCTSITDFIGDGATNAG